MNSKIPYEILSDKINDLFFVYLDVAPPHLSWDPEAFSEERKEIVSRHDFAQEWLVTENGWTMEQYNAEFDQRFQNYLEEVGTCTMLSF